MPSSRPSAERSRVPVAVPVMDVGDMGVVMDHLLMGVRVGVVSPGIERRGAGGMGVAIVVKVVVPVPVLVDHRLVSVGV